MGRNPIAGIDPDGYWFRNRQRIEMWPDDSSVRDVDYPAIRHIRTWITAAYLAGAAEQFRATTRMSPHIAQFIEMVVLLYGEDYYDALTTGLRAANQETRVPKNDSCPTCGTTTSGQSVDGDSDLPAL